jgi:serine/threonine-protein kinase RsbW
MDNLTWVTLPAEIGSLRSASAFLRQGATCAGMSEEVCGKLDLIVEELVVNIALYAFPNGTPGTFDIGYSVAEPGRLFVQICDEGGEFNPFDSDPPDFTRGLADRPVGGLGIYLVKTIGESMKYERDRDRNVISFHIR